MRCSGPVGRRVPGRRWSVVEEARALNIEETLHTPIATHGEPVTAAVKFHLERQRSFGIEGRAISGISGTLVGASFSERKSPPSRFHGESDGKGVKGSRRTLFLDALRRARSGFGELPSMI